MPEVNQPEVELPPLPEEDRLLHELHRIADDLEYGLPVYECPAMEKMREAVRAYARAAVLAERERCAAVCDRLTWALDHGDNPYIRPANALACAAAIRSGEAK